MGRPGREYGLWGKVLITVVVEEEESTVFSSISNSFPTGAFVHMAFEAGSGARAVASSSVRSTTTKRDVPAKKRGVQWRTI
jgi:hypothetical protein